MLRFAGMADDAYRLDAGRVSLDLMATFGDRRAERLPDLEALDTWLLAGWLVEALCAADAEDLARTRALRGALFGVVDAEFRGGRPSAADLDVINAAAVVPGQAPRLQVGAEGLRREPMSPGVGEVLGLTARDAIADPMSAWSALLSTGLLLATGQRLAPLGLLGCALIVLCAAGVVLDAAVARAAGARRPAPGAPARRVCGRVTRLLRT